VNSKYISYGVWASTQTEFVERYVFGKERDRNIRGKSRKSIRRRDGKGSQESEAEERVFHIASDILISENSR
jgi:hypothetical protein